MTVLRTTATVAGATALALAATVGLAGSAHAGSNGQQVVVISPAGSNPTSYLLDGYDQSGNRVTHCFTPTGYETWISGWWWKGSLTVGRYFSSTNCNNYDMSQALFTDTRNIPATSSNDWQAVAHSGNKTLSNNVQIEFFDNQHIANSVEVYFTLNQNGVWTTGCWATPGWDTMFSGWWWHGDATIKTYASSDCTGTPNDSFDWGLGASDGGTVGITD